MSRHRPVHRACLIALGVVLLPGIGRAQTPPASAQTQPPNLAMPAPMGIQRGTTLDLTLTGANLADPTGLWTNIPGAKTTIPTDHDNGKDPAKLRVRFEVPKETPIGLYALRLTTARGLSNLRLFCVDDLPQVLETDTNRARATPQTVPVPSVVVGRADAEVSDYFKISVKAGQRLSFEVLGHRLGSAFDPQITVYEAATQREAPGGHSNDSPGLQTDARLTYTFKNAGDYLIEVRDVMFRGGPDFWYRLRIGDFPCATTPIPMAAKRGSKVLVSFAGPAVEGIAPVTVTVPVETQDHAIFVSPRGVSGLAGWPVALAVSDLDEVVEQEPNNEPAQANRIPMPGSVTGRFQVKGDLDHFVFAAQKGQRLVIEGQTFELHSPTELLMILKNATGAELARSKPDAPPRLDFIAPADGDYTLAVEHLLSWGGPAESYRIRIAPQEPDFELALLSDRHEVPQGGITALSVQATRRDYSGPIEIRVVGSPAISGQATILPGQPASPTLPATLLPLTANPDAPRGVSFVTIQGKAVINGKSVVRQASLKTVLSAGLGGLLLPPENLLDQVGLVVSEKAPFTLIAKLDTTETLRGNTVHLTISATRAPGFTEEIALTPLGLPAHVAATLKAIPKGQDEIKAPLTPAAGTPVGAFAVSVIGKTRFEHKDFTVSAAPLSFVVILPFDLQVSPHAVELAPGGKAKITVTAVRKGGYQGPITVELRNLPAHVKAGKATIAPAQTSTEHEIHATGSAAAAARADVHVLGGAAAAANQQNSSPHFTVRVAKK